MTPQVRDAFRLQHTVDFPHPMAAQSIDDVLAQLDRIIVDARRKRSRLGYFASLYRDVTARVKAAIENGEFEDGPRMERLDVVFAQRYLDALETRDSENGPTRAWSRTFEATERWRPLILQHLLLGMNAHINLDLGIAAAEVAEQNEISDLEADFDYINRILGAMVEDVQTRVATVSPWIGVLDRLGGTADEVISNFCLTQARNDAWDFARTLAPLNPGEREVRIRAKDQETAQRTDKILRPGGLKLLPVLCWIRLWEDEHVPSVIDTLSATSPATEPTLP
jgi:hypothetical protein